MTKTNTNGTRGTRRIWKNICVEDTKAFLGIHVIMGICRLPTIEMYWSVRMQILAGL